VTDSTIVTWLSLLSRKSVCFFVTWLAPQSIATKSFSWQLASIWLLPRRPSDPLFSSLFFPCCLLLRHAVRFFFPLNKRLSIATKFVLLIFSTFFCYNEVLFSYSLLPCIFLRSGRLNWFAHTNWTRLIFFSPFWFRLSFVVFFFSLKFRKCLPLTV
jgi:hypothetical protein